MGGVQWRRLGMTAAVLAVLALVPACENEVRPGTELKQVAGAHPDTAPYLFKQYGCGSCHTIPGVRGAKGMVGPPLQHFSRRRFVAGVVPNDAEHLMRFIRDPKSIHPKTAMPDVGVSAADARDMAGYLLQQR